MTTAPLDFEDTLPGDLAPVLELEGDAPSRVQCLERAPLRPEVELQDAARPLRVGLLNNMPDAALLATERQFRRLVGPDVDLRLFAFRETARGPVAATHLEAHYAWHEELGTAGLDALIVSGSEPRCARLEDEPYYAALGAVVDWAAIHTRSTLFSCLAAHAAVQHLNGIRRRRLPGKCSGIFSQTATGPHRLLDGMPARVETPHSRWNDLSEAELVAHGYTVLRRSDAVGVDLFVRDRESLMVFLQGHPEYDLNSLAREYRRDLNRFLGGTGAVRPAVPANYFTEETETLLARAEADGAADPRVLLAEPDQLPLRPSGWPSASAQLFRNWLSCVAAQRSAVGRHGVAPR